MKYTMGITQQGNVSLIYLTFVFFLFVTCGHQSVIVVFSRNFVVSCDAHQQTDSPVHSNMKAFNVELPTSS